MQRKREPIAAVACHDKQIGTVARQPQIRWLVNATRDEASEEGSHLKESTYKWTGGTGKWTGGTGKTKALVALALTP